MRAIFASFVFVVSIGACGPERQHGGDDDDGGKMDACVGLECQVVNCMAMSMPDTSVSGTIFAPNGSLPLYGINVYVPREDPGPFTEGVICDQCANGLPGGAVVQTQTDETGKFQLSGIPAGDNVKLVVTQGKWRRVVPLPTVPACANMAVDPQMTRLPKNKAEGDIPKIAISTGSADALECLALKLGIDLTEFTNDAGAGRVHMFSDPSSGGGEGANKFSAGGNFGDSKNLWGDVTKLKNYDIVILSCEGNQHSESKSQPAFDALKGYADLGGRVFLSHWHNIWIEGASQDGTGEITPDWAAVAQFDDGNGAPNTDMIDEANNSKGMSFATWMLNVMGSMTRDVIELQGGTGKSTCVSVDNAKAERWVYSGNRPQNFQFTTPQNVDPASRCGKVVFSDMHVSGDSMSKTNLAFPTGCSNSGLTPQEKALAFMFFDISSCVGILF